MRVLLCEIGVYWRDNEDGTKFTWNRVSESIHGYLLVVNMIIVITRITGFLVDSWRIEILYATALVTFLNRIETGIDNSLFDEKSSVTYG